MTYAALSIPTPFPVGPTNVYLIKKDPVTLIDCGPNTLEAKQALTEQLGSHGFELESIRQIIITHAHIDHYGLAAEIQRVSGAPVFIHEKEVRRVQDRLSHIERIISILANNGMPEDHCQRQLEYFNWEAKFIEPPEEIIGVKGGHTFSFDDFDLEGLVTPGHTVGHICLYQEKDGLLFAGDTILDKITPNPITEPLLEQPSEREKSLIQYIDSINRLRKLRIARILPGHGEQIADADRRFEQLDMHHRRRKEEVSQRAARKRVFTAFELAMEFFQNLKEPLDYGLAMSEILGYLDLLENDGKVRRQQKSSGIIYLWVPLV